MASSVINLSDNEGRTGNIMIIGVAVVVVNLVVSVFTCSTTSCSGCW